MILLIKFKPLFLEDCLESKGCGKLTTRLATMGDTEQETPPVTIPPPTSSTATVVTTVVTATPIQPLELITDPSTLRATLEKWLCRFVE